MNATEKVGTEKKTPAPRKEFVLLKDHRHAGKDIKADGKTKVSLTARQEENLKKKKVI